MRGSFDVYLLLSFFLGGGGGGGGGVEMVLLSTLTPIFLEILIKEDLLLDMRLLLEVVLLVGKLLCGIHMRCWIQRRNIWLLQKLVRKLFGSEIFLVRIVNMSPN